MPHRYGDRVSSGVALQFACPVCAQRFQLVLDFTDCDERVIGCVPCQTRFRVTPDGMVRPANRKVRPFSAQTLPLVD